MEQEQNIDFVASNMPSSESELQKYVISVLEKAKKNFEENESSIKKKREELTKKYEIEKRYKTTLIKIHLKSLNKYEEGAKTNVKYNVVGKVKPPNNILYFTCCVRCNNIGRLFFLKDRYRYCGIDGFYTTCVDIEEYINRNHFCAVCNADGYSFRYYYYLPEFDDEIEKDKPKEEIKLDKLIEKSIQDIKKELPPCGIFNCDGSCNDFRHVVDVMQNTKADLATIPKQDNKGNSNIVYFSIFSVMTLLIHFFIKFFM